MTQIEFQAILFDLDGTLLDTLADIANATNAALTRMGFPTHPRDAYRYFLGGGMDCLVRRTVPEHCHESKTLKEYNEAIIDEYRTRWAENTKPYPGVPKLLAELDNRGIVKVVLSNKPDDFTRKTVEKLLPDFCFEIVRGARPEVPVKPDPTAALQIADELDIPPGRFIYLGDTDTDMQTANAAGMFAAGALWGFRTAEELSANGAQALFKTPQEVLNMFD
ncbi:MAG: HAD family hydrolase [Planctomycetota bacterium]|nr:HAD family hydrolase [Planctomycetota bacterium]